MAKPGTTKKATSGSAKKNTNSSVKKHTNSSGKKHTNSSGKKHTNSSGKKTSASSAKTASKATKQFKSEALVKDSDQETPPSSSSPMARNTGGNMSSDNTPTKKAAKSRLNHHPRYLDILNRGFEAFIPTDLTVGEAKTTDSYKRLEIGTWTDSDGVTRPAYFYPSGTGQSEKISLVKYPKPESEGRNNQLSFKATTWRPEFDPTCFHREDGRYNGAGRNRDACQKEWYNFMIKIYFKVLPGELKKRKPVPNTKSSNEEESPFKAKSKPMKQEIETEDLTDLEGLPDDERREYVSKQFKRQYPGLETQLDIWNSYVSDKDELDMKDPIVCEVVREAWREICDNSGRTGPPNKVLQKAMHDMRKDNLSTVTITKVWQKWESSESSGAKHEEVIDVDYSLDKRFEGVRAGRIEPSGNRFAKLRVTQLEGAELEAAQVSVGQVLASYYDYKQRKGIA